MLLCLMMKAQDRIDRVIDDLEKKADVETTYSENRTPKKHKLTRVTKVLNLHGPNSKAYYKRLVKAFEDERTNAVSAIKNKQSYCYKFVDDKGSSTYTLTNSQVVKSWSSASDNKDDQSVITITHDSDGTVTYTTGTLTGREKADVARAKAKLARKQAKEARRRARQARERQSQNV